MFLLYRLQDTETRYLNLERECYAIVKCLAEIRWLVIGNKHPVIIYTDYKALKPIFTTGQTEKGRIATWLNRLGEFNTKLVHRPSRDQHIGVADGLSQMPSRINTTQSLYLADKLAMPVLHTEVLEQRIHPASIMPQNKNLEKYRRSPMYY